MCFLKLLSNNNFLQLTCFRKNKKKFYVYRKNMSHVKRVEKKKVVQPSEDCSCTSTDTTTSSTDCSSVTPVQHEKCDEHCSVEHKEGKTCCRRKCRTICVVECVKEVNYKYKWDYKTKEDKPWRDCDSEKIPKKCEDKDYPADKKHHDKKDDKKDHKKY